MPGHGFPQNHEKNYYNYIEERLLANIKRINITKHRLIQTSTVRNKQYCSFVQKNTEYQRKKYVQKSEIVS